MSPLHFIASQGNETAAVCGATLTRDTAWTRIHGWFHLADYQPERKRCRKCARRLAVREESDHAP